MAKGDIKIHDTGGRINTPVRRFPHAKYITTINAGEPVGFTIKWGGVGTEPDYYVIALTDAKPVIGTDYFVGIAATTSTATTSADGYVDVYLDQPGTVYRAKAKTAGTFNSQAEIDSSVGYIVAFDLTGTSYTVDVATASRGNTNGLVVIGGLPETSEVLFTVRSAARWIS